MSEPVPSAEPAATPAAVFRKSRRLKSFMRSPPVNDLRMVTADAAWNRLPF
jgi:hypothetical protein